MDFGLIIGCFALAACFLVAVVVFIIWKRLNFAEGRTSAILDEWGKFKQAQEEEAAEEEEALRTHMSEIGKKGVQVREDNKEARSAAMAEGRALLSTLTPAILTDKAMQERARAGLAQLAVKYPKVADEVAESLLGEYKQLAPFKDMIKQVVAEALLKPPAAQQESAQQETGVPLLY